MTTQNNNEHLSGESNSRENFENEWMTPAEIDMKIGTKYKDIRTPNLEYTVSDREKRNYELEFLRIKNEFYKEQLKERE